MKTSFSWLFVCTALLLGGIACADSDPRRLSLLDSHSESRKVSDEQRRLQSLQLIRYVDGFGWEGFMPAASLTASNGPLVDYCSLQSICPGVTNNEDCFFFACSARANLCAARMVQSAATVRAEGIELPKAYKWRDGASGEVDDLANYDPYPIGVTLPPQSPGARVALLRVAIDLVSNTLKNLTDFAQCPTTPGPLPEWDVTGARELPWHGGVFSAGLYAEVTVQAYDLLKELSEDTTDAILAAADAQRSLSSTTAQAAARSFAGEQLSRAEAAHLLIGGSPGLLGETNRAFCSSPELSGRARAALALLRRAAPDPADVVSPSVGLSTLLEGAAFPQGSIRERLEILDGQTIASIFDYTGFSLEDFAQARSYLAQEIQVFARERSVTFVPEAISAIPVGMVFYVATAREPEPPPPEYFAALARRWSDAGPRRPAGGELQATDASASLAVAMGRIREAVGLVDGQAHIAGLPAAAVDAKEQFQGPLNLLAARDERVAQLGWRKASGATRFYVDGHNAGHKLKIVRGLSGLLCATTGQVEGSPCSSLQLNSYSVADLTSTAEALGANPQVVGRGYSQAAWGDDVVALSWADPTPVFLVKPKDPTYEVAGTYTVLAGFQLSGLAETDANGSIPYRFAIYPELEKKAGEILRPSTKWCTRAAVECDGTSFDERLPLENELSDDGDGVESSWRHYLTMAEQAAAEAHALGEQYILTGLEIDRNLEANQLREAADRQRYLSRVESEMETLQEICGTAMDTADILTLLGGEAVGPTNGLGCAVANDCCGGAVGPLGMCPYSCVNNLCIANPCVQGDDSGCPSPYQCVAQRCVYSPKLRVQDEPSPSEGLSRLRECVGTGTIHEYVALGNVPLCLWDDGPANPAKICSGSDAQYPCPAAARRLSDGSFDCQGRVKPGRTAKLVAETLNLVESSALLDLGEDPCDMLRKARASSDPLPGEANVVLDFSGAAQLYLQESFQPPLFGADHMVHADRIGWRVEPPTSAGNVASLLVDRKVRWTTQPGATTWPCSPFVPGDAPDVCRHGSGSLFCDMAMGGCSQTTEAGRNAASRVSQRLFAAALVLKGLGSGDFQELTVPVMADAASVPALFGSPVGTADKGTFFEQGYRWGIKRYYHDPTEPGSPPPFWRYTYNAWGAALQGVVTLSSNQFDLLASNASNAMFLVPLPSAVGPPPITIAPLLPSIFRANGAPRLTDWAHTLSNVRALPHGDPQAGDFQIDSPYLTPHVDYSPATIHDAAELLCEVTRRDPWYREPFSCPTYSMTMLLQDGDFRALSEYADCRVDMLNRAVGSLVLTRVPVRVAEGLRTFSVTGASPLVGGQMGSAMDRLRASLTRYSEFGRTMGELAQDANGAIAEMNLALREIGQQSAVDRLHAANAEEEAYIASLRGAQQRVKLDQIEFQKWVILGKAAVDCAMAFAEGASNTIGSLGTSNGVAAAKCGHAVALAMLEERSLSYEERIIGLEEDIAVTQQAIANNNALIAEGNAVLSQVRHAREMIVLVGRLRSAMSGMSGLATEAQGSLEELRASVTEIESLRLKAQRSMMRAMQFETTQAAVTEDIESVLNAKLNTAKKRYLRAHDNAVRFAFLAKRAIEQRLGLHLSELRSDMPLVEAPSTWEADICAAEGVDYEALRAGAAERGEVSKVPVDYSGMYIGDFVAKLKNVVESYRLQYDFHEGTDEAIASVRDDVLNVRAPCPEMSTNLIKFSGKLDALVPLGEGGGWEIQGCNVDEDEGVSGGCFSLQEASSSNLPNGTGFLLALGSEAVAQTRLAQRVKLGAGRHRLSWFTDPSQGLSDVTLVALDGAQLDPVVYNTLSQWVAFSSAPGEWPRHYRLYDLDAEQEVAVAIGPAGSAMTYSAGGVMLEELLDSEIGGHPELQVPGPYVATSDSRVVQRPFCEDSDGKVFRERSWKYRCTKLCSDGFSDNCLDSSLADRCYWETTFSLDLRDLESGRIFEQSGFARGNFNYRIEDIGVNFVGTELRDCSQSPLPSTCNAAGFVTYSLQHLGPLFVRNHTGGDFPVKLFDGKIEHARGLGLERYLTNPLSSTDRELLTPYLRKELTGRPLDGNFVLRVWDENGVSFSAIEDVQLYLKYRYWTRFN